VLAACGDGGRPNVLLISLDAVRSDHLKSYGYARETAPSLSELAREGTRFANSYAQASSTVPTHASMFTGRYPFQHGSYHFMKPLRDEETTLAELFAAQGYRTFSVASSVRFLPYSGFAQGFESYQVVDELRKNERGRAVTDRAIEQLEGPGPFLGFLHYFGPHAPYAPPEEYRSLYHEGLASPRPENTAVVTFFRRKGGVEPEVLEYLVALYDAEIRFLDDELARLFEAVRESAHGRNTIVVVTADHGEEFQDHGGLSHGTHLHEELLRIPLIFWWPEHIAPGAVFERPVQTIDLLPTLAALAGVEAPAGLPGRSLAAELLAGSEATESGANITVAQQRPETWAVSAMLPKGRFKYIMNDGEFAGLFDLDRDPGETKRVETDHPEERAALEAIAAALGVAQSAEVPELEHPPEGIRERLRAIGYVE
jgi:arylsulfatase A-like enzyme